jgi:hypothetical protein
MVKINFRFKEQNTVLLMYFMLLIFAVLSILPIAVQPVYAQTKESGYEKSLTILKNEVLSYFEPVTGKVIAVSENTVKIDTGSEKSIIRPGMRLNAFKEGVSFIHPVTKEPLGKIEMPIGNIEITAITDNEISGMVIGGKPEDYLDAKIKIPGTKIKLLFVQGSVDWFLGDSYYQILKESGRFDLIDTEIQTDDIAKIAAEAKTKSAEAALILQSEDFSGQINLTQRLLWAADSRLFSEKDVPIDANYVKDLRFKSQIFAAKEGEALLSYQIPFGVRKLAAGDLDGDGSTDIILASGDKIRIYKPGVDLKLLWEFTAPSTSEVLWLDATDSNKNKKDEVIITSIRDGEVTSYIYELKGSEFVQLWKASDTFIRKLDSELIAQGYTKRDGYDGGVYYIIESGGVYKKGDSIKLPEDVNIYDFQPLTASDGRKAVVAWDNRGFLNLYDEKGIRIWLGKEDFGGFAVGFKKESLSGMAEKGNWYIKDRLIVRNNEVFAPKRKPLLGMARGLGYKSSEIKGLWWNGISVEERGLLEEIGGEILDYAIVGDRIVVISMPLFGIKAKNILKGESPFVIMMYIFSLKGK